ncbi:DUF6766 family protein [Planosporangium sp. 12N6]|uniref:DUF6766 family protein n=1 Tax=Planosporangium spinosum TaxID=3402278 RepID=UPI003CF637EC
MSRWLKLNALSLVMFAAFVVFLVLQSVFGWLADNQDLADHARATQSYWSYVGSGAFVEATFENWESEFLQMGSYVLLAAYLVQKGSPESKPLDESSDADRAPVTPDSPWPARRGGAVLWLYQNSLALALLGLFVVSFVLHLLGATAAYNAEQALHGQPATSAVAFLAHPQFWFQSMQNWQSEFLSVGVLIVFSIFLRQRGSSQSKPVEAPHTMTGS